MKPWVSPSSFLLPPSSFIIHHSSFIIHHSSFVSHFSIQHEGMDRSSLLPSHLHLANSSLTPLTYSSLSSLSCVIPLLSSLPSPRHFTPLLTSPPPFRPPHRPSLPLIVPHRPPSSLTPLLTPLLTPSPSSPHLPPIHLYPRRRRARVLDVAEQRGEEVEKAQENILNLTRTNSTLQEEKSALESQVSALEVNHGTFFFFLPYSLVLLIMLQVAALEV